MSAATDGFRPLTRAEVQHAIGTVDLSAEGRVRRTADILSRDLTGDGRDLLHEAICRSLTSRRCKEALTVEQFIGGIMRSIASTARRSRERGREQHIFLPAADIAERLAFGGYTVASPEHVIEVERVRELCANVLDQLAAASPAQAALIEAVGLGLRGQDLADRLGITLGDLATLRRALKRHVQRLWPEIATAISPEDIDRSPGLA